MITEPSPFIPLLKKYKSLTAEEFFTIAPEDFEEFISDLPLTNSRVDSTVISQIMPFIANMQFSGHDIRFIDKVLIISRMIVSYNYSKHLIEYPFFWSEVCSYWIGESKYQRIHIVKLVGDILKFLEEHKELTDFQIMADMPKYKVTRTPQILRLILFIVFVILGIFILSKIIQFINP